MYELIGDNYKSQIYNDKLEELIGNHDYASVSAMTKENSKRSSLRDDNKSEISVEKIN